MVCDINNPGVSRIVGFIERDNQTKTMVSSVLFCCSSDDAKFNWRSCTIKNGFNKIKPDVVYGQENKISELFEPSFVKVLLTNFSANSRFKILKRSDCKSVCDGYHFQSRSDI